ncbi:glycoside hydrolase family 15 protein [Mycetocola reblochoni]|uniref:Glucoamylase n=2 Tax=Mycetocola reblochoni TaxID=331618 RepID=A0A1R4KD46_9MICO|nr:glycoside hydrolase family 15 protein [Mycetocola reblochoni]RLP71245.1 glycoside hydrolase family 15 protein [Mycetocola reblochoni]SJN42207.1 Glucoamylase [Mycetocola reblochoni REB411]
MTGPWAVGTRPLPARSEPSAPDERDADGYADLAGYASIGNGRTVALVARDGRIDWLPLPNLDSPPAFGALLDAELGGHIALRPDRPFTVTRRYREGSDVLETTFRTDRGVARVVDGLTIGLSGQLPWNELARRIEGVEGEVSFTAEVAPGTLLRTASPWVSRTVHGPVLRVDGLTLGVRTLGEASTEILADRVLARYRTSPGSTHLLAVVASDHEPLTLPDARLIDDRLSLTERVRGEWSSSFDYRGPHADQVRTSALILRQLIFRPTGAIAAAATTSLPESLTVAKNWDYRFSWIRDTAFTLSALYQFGVREETHAAMSRMLSQIGGFARELVVLAGLDGNDPGDGVHEHDVPGWRNSRPVVTGNRATGQLQLGVYGDLFTIVGEYVDHGNVLDDDTARLMGDVANQAADHWRIPDSGIWELPEIRQYTTSKLGCWQALDRAVRLADAGQITGEVDRWRTAMEDIREWVETECWSEDLGAYEFFPGSGRLDASILLHAISGFDRGERMRSTLDALVDRLGSGPHLYRFSGADEEEGAFVACGFWLVAAFVHTGQIDRASELMDALVDACPNDVGVLAEMIDPASGAAVGNLPQALSHLALINAGLTIAAARR